MCKHSVFVPSALSLIPCRQVQSQVHRACLWFAHVFLALLHLSSIVLDATMPGRCHSNVKWLEKDEYKSWMKKSGKNPKKAFYFACKKRIDLNVMGESTLKCKKLEEYVRLCGNEKAFRISEFFISSVSKTMVQSTGSRVQQLIQTSQMAIVASAAAPHKSSVAKYPVSSLLKWKMTSVRWLSCRREDYTSVAVSVRFPLYISRWLGNVPVVERAL